MSRAAAGIPPIPFDVEGFVGCRDQRSQKYGPGEMEMIYNMLPESTDRPSKLLLRPGYKRYCGAGVGTAVQIGVGVGGCLQAIDGYLGVGRVYLSLLISTSGIWSLFHTNQTLALQLTNAQIVAAGANLAGFARAVIFNGKLIVATGSGKLWSWNGNSGGGVTVLASSPSGCIDLTVVGGKIVALDGNSTLFWSEEGDETIGYNTAPYSNFWTLRQTGDNKLLYIYGTNDGVLFQRAGSGMGIIRGDVDANWQTTSTKDELSTTIGATDLTLRGGARLIAGGSSGSAIFFDQRARPCIYRPGQGIVELWRQLPRLFAETKGASWDTGPWLFESSPAEPNLATTARPLGLWYDRAWKCNCFAIDSFLGLHYIFCFDAESDRFLGAWAITGTSDAANFYGYALFHLAGANEVPAPIRIDASGNVFWQDNFNLVNAARSWNDESAAGTGGPVVGTVIGPPHGSNPTLSYWFDRIDVLVEARNPSLTTALGYVTSSQHKGALTPADQSQIDSSLSNTPYQRRIEFGLNGEVLARWLMPQIQISTAGGQDQQAGLYGYHVEARPDTQNVGAV